MLDGSYKILYLYIDSAFKPIGCLTDNSFSESTETMNATTRANSDGWVTSTPSLQSYSISFSGVETLDDRGDTIVTFAEIRALKRARTKIQWRIVSSEGGDAEHGYGYITSLGEAMPMGDAVTFDGVIEGSGSVTTDAWTPPSPPELIDMIPYYEVGKS